MVVARPGLHRYVMFNSRQAKRSRRIVGISVICLFLLLVPAGYEVSAREPAGQYSHSGKGKLLYIEGVSDLFADFKAWAWQSGIHIESRMGGSIWNEKNGTKVSVYNKENKVFFRQDAESYLVDLKQDYVPIPIETLEPSTKTEFLGKPAKKYLGYANLGRLGRQCVAEFTCIDNDRLTPVAHRMWCRFLGLNRFDFGIPVQLNQKRAAVVSCTDKVMKLGQPVWCRVLVTNTMKDLPGTTDSFAVKPDWKQAKDKAGMLFGSNGDISQKDLDDLFRSKTK